MIDNPTPLITEKRVLDRGSITSMSYHSYFVSDICVDSDTYFNKNLVCNKYR